MENYWKQYIRYFFKNCLKEQYKLLYLALMEAFSGPSRCMTTEKFVGAYQEQTCYANCGGVVQKSSQSSEFEVILNRSTDKISNKLSLSNNASFSVIIILMTTESHNFFKPHSLKVMCIWLKVAKPMSILILYENIISYFVSVNSNIRNNIISAIF